MVEIKLVSIMLEVVNLIRIRYLVKTVTLKWFIRLVFVITWQLLDNNRWIEIHLEKEIKIKLIETMILWHLMVYQFNVAQVLMIHTYWATMHQMMDMLISTWVWMNTCKMVIQWTRVKWPINCQVNLKKIKLAILEQLQVIHNRHLVVQMVLFRDLLFRFTKLMKITQFQLKHKSHLLDNNEEYE